MSTAKEIRIPSGPQDCNCVQDGCKCGVGPCQWALRARDCKYRTGEVCPNPVCNCAPLWLYER